MVFLLQPGPDILYFSQVAGPVKATPPFLTEEVEVVVPVQPCELYTFEVKLVSPTNSEMGTVAGIKLAALPNMPDYIPPPITQVIQVQMDLTRPNKLFPISVE
jgi:hypothetical protein